MPGLIRLSQGGGPGTAKVNCMDTCCSGMGFDVSSTFFVEMVCKVQLNIVFNGCQTSKGTEMEIHVSLALRARSDQGRPGSKPGPKALLSPAISWAGQAIKILGSRG